MTVVRIALAALCAFLPLALAPAAGLAHGVNVFAWAENDVIHVEASFAGGKAVHHGEVLVRDAGSGELLLTGTTDAQGEFSFPVPAAARAARAGLEILVRAGAGHQDSWPMAATDYLPGEQAAPPQAQGQEQTQDDAQDNTQTPGNVSTPASQAAPPAGTGLTPAQTRALARHVALAVADELAPVKRRLAALENRGHGVTEVAGGIGYLVGLAGIILYCRSRKQG